MRRTLLAVLVLCGAPVLAAPARAESVVMSIDRAAALNFMRAATPWTVEVGMMGLTERFTFTNPRELRFEQGKVRLTVDCRGEPVSVSAVLQPTLTVAFDRQRNAFVAKVESLPVSVAGMGTVQLDRYIDPIALPVSFSQTLDQGIPGLVIDYLIRDLKVLEQRIEARADLVFRKTPPATRATARR